jgi:hypothetical protein
MMRRYLLETGIEDFQAAVALSRRDKPAGTPFWRL